MGGAKLEMISWLPLTASYVHDHSVTSSAHVIIMNQRHHFVIKINGAYSYIVYSL